MGLKVGTPSTPTTSSSLHWSHPHSPSSSQTLASAISSSKRRTCDGPLFCRYAERSALYGAHQQLYRSRSCHNLRSRVRTIRRALTASLADEEFSKQIQDLALRFQFTQDPADDEHGSRRFNESFQQRLENIDAKLLENFKPFDAALEPPDFPKRDDIIPANIERKPNSFEIPLSLRTIKRKKQWQEGFVEAGESAYCSVKKAFSSMVFIIRELHSYTLQMREVLFYEDLQGILASVQKEMHASFVWLFQKVFSQTPTLMVYVMILLANYSVYSISSNVAIAATPQVYGEVSVVEDRSKLEQKFDSSIIKTIKLSSPDSGNTSSVGGNNGGGGKYKQVASGRDDDGRFSESNYNGSITPEGLLSTSRTNGEESVSTQAAHEEEVTLWKSMVEEASRMQAASRDETLDQETMQRFVSPVDAKIEADDHSDYFKTELLYQTGLAQEPNSPLLLANYAQFLYLVAQDFDRAEEYFKRAAKVEPKDAEALNKYANFLWVVRKDLWAAEETYLEAIDAEPDNSYYAANYAHFLWNTGGEDTCFPLAS
ncbi:hypothetical protein BUALT_Bualt13G0092800 [Buddleja alternifolia]|uniref:Tetratricopeptide repeat-like superfamily protein n=1 Tax=Buddleja alternifolia TaxID=168488 RepID=A0AAV6WSR3_9LAMI|nr:hypothetical protein BUALT_Bualt13G0092300 [Buddleja alternifolia]KAG8371487.1 hypothetical protein BUALT_Bualt13G0092800 [Buddleja alternifolia]